MIQTRYHWQPQKTSQELMINTRFTARVVFLFTCSISWGQGQTIFSSFPATHWINTQFLQEARNDVGTCLYSYLIHMRIILCTAGNFIDKIEKIIKKMAIFFLKRLNTLFDHQFRYTSLLWICLPDIQQYFSTFYSFTNTQIQATDDIL